MEIVCGKVPRSFYFRIDELDALKCSRILACAIEDTVDTYHPAKVTLPPIEPDTFEYFDKIVRFRRPPLDHWKSLTPKTIRAIIDMFDYLDVENEVRTDVEGWIVQSGFEESVEKERSVLFLDLQDLAKKTDSNYPKLYDACKRVLAYQVYRREFHGVAFMFHAFACPPLYDTYRLKDAPPESNAGIHVTVTDSNVRACPALQKQMYRVFWKGSWEVQYMNLGLGDDDLFELICHEKTVHQEDTWTNRFHFVIPVPQYFSVEVRFTGSVLLCRF